MTSPGRPRPNVTWWRDTALVDASWEAAEEGATENRLTLGPLTRADLGAELTCWAANHPLATPRSATVTVNMIRELAVTAMRNPHPDRNTMDDIRIRDLLTIRAASRHLKDERINAKARAWDRPKHQPRKMRIN